MKSLPLRFQLHYLNISWKGKGLILIKINQESKRLVNYIVIENQALDGNQRSC